MSTLLLTHPVCMKHDTGEHHPERAARLRKILSYLNREEFFLLHRDEAPMASHAQLELAHPTNYIEAVERAVPKVGEHLNAIDGDTIVSADTWEAALRSVGGACYGVDEVMAKKARNVFVRHVHRAIMQKRPRQWGFVFSIMPPLQPSTPLQNIPK